MKNINFFNHSLLKFNSIQNIKKVLNSNVITSGKIGEAVERKISNFFCINYCLLTNSWTNGAIATLLALGIKKNDEVIIPALTFVACANVVELVGAKPIFVDVDKNSLLINKDEIIKKISKKTRAIMVVHLYGNMFDVKNLKIYLDKKKLKIPIIEDCAHSFESKLKNEKVGKYSKVSIFSFYATKNITCGEGGAIITKDRILYEKIKQTRSHGITKNFQKRFFDKNYSHWDMKILGTKANLPDLLSCLLPSQIDKIYKNRKIRVEAFKFYNKILSDLNLRMQFIDPLCESSFHLYPIHVNPKIRNKVIRYLNKNGISCTINYEAIPLLTYYKNKYKILPKDFPISNEWGKGTISLPFYPGISKNDQIYIAGILKKALKKYV